MISICICTYKRKEGLANLLKTVSASIFELKHRIEIVVVDNDRDGSANQIVSSVAEQASFPVRYILEPESGVSFARNRCVREARGEWIAFLDDDEYPSEGWLEKLESAAKVFSADAVFGPIVAVYDVPPSVGVDAFGGHSRPRFATGTQIGWGDCRTGNVLFKRTIFERFGPFKREFSVSGGEDSDFFWRCIDGGAKVIWCDEAVVFESVPEERTKRRWILRRSFLGGRLFAQLRASRFGPSSLCRDAVWGVGGVLIYGPLAVVGTVFGWNSSIRYQRKLAGSAGKISALFGGRVGDYGGKS